MAATPEEIEVHRAFIAEQESGVVRLSDLPEVNPDTRKSEYDETPASDEKKVDNTATIPTDANLSKLLPKKNQVTLSTGQTVSVRKWQVEDLRELSQAMGSIAVTTASMIAEGLQGSELITALMFNQATLIQAIVQHTIGFSSEKMLALDLDDFLLLAESVYQVNESFFRKVAGLVESLGKTEKTTTESENRVQKEAVTTGSPS